MCSHEWRHAQLETFITASLRNGKSFEDKLNVIYLATCSLTYSSKLPESIEKGLNVLSKLGIELRGHGSGGT
jgi:hypothetical protein